MGMFDYVNFEMNCPKCGRLVRGFQSKDSYCDLSKIDPQAVDHMYSACHECGAWMSLSRNILPKPKDPRETPYTLEEVKKMGFELTTTG